MIYVEFHERAPQRFAIPDDTDEQIEQLARRVLGWKDRHGGPFPAFRLFDASGRELGGN